MNKFLAAGVCAAIMVLLIPCAGGQEPVAKPQEPVAVDVPATDPASTGMTDIFDDKALVQGYETRLAGAAKDFILAMINDDDLYVYKKIAALRIFRDKFALQMVARERGIIERVLLRQLQRSSVVNLQIELMHTLVIMDRFRYFDAMVPLLIQKMDHYDPYVNETAYGAMDHINAAGPQRPREARIEFNTLRKIFFLSRKKLKAADPSDPKLRNKLQLLRWSIKVLGTEELRSLPPEVISLM
jgi:hypothetical protein